MQSRNNLHCVETQLLQISAVMWNMRSQNTVKAYLKSKQLLPFGFALLFHDYDLELEHSTSLSCKHLRLEKQLKSGLIVGNSKQ